MASMSPREFLERIAKGKPIPGVLLLGSEAYLRDMCRKRIVDAYVSEDLREWAVTRLSAREESISAILGQAQTIPMFAPRQVIFVSDAEAWEKLGDESRDALAAELSRYFEDPSPTTLLVFEAAKLDQRMKLAKIFAEKTMVVATELPEELPDRARIAVPLAKEMARELGVALDADAAEELVDMLNGELAAIHTELEKLATYVGAKGRITQAEIELLVISAQKYSVWELADMLASRKPASALRFLDRLLRDGAEPVALVGGLAWMYRKLLEAQELPRGVMGREAAGRLRMREEQANLAVTECRKFSRAQLASGLRALYEADSLLKSGGPSHRVLMESLVVQLATPKIAS
jgi:DNA polymerase III subunit delta